MPAMHDDVYDSMCEQLSVHLNTMLQTLKFEMTHEECINLVAPAEDVHLLKTAAAVAHVSTDEDWMIINTPATLDGEGRPQCMLMMRTHEQKVPPLRPRYPQWQAASKENLVAGDKVLTWLEQRLVLGRRFGTARHVLHKLRQECDTGHQLRFMFPAVMHLCKPGKNERMDRWIDKFAAFKPCRFTPAITPAFKKAVQDSSALLTSVALLGDGVPERMPGFVTISEYEMPRFELDGVRTRRL